MNQGSVIVSSRLDSLDRRCLWWCVQSISFNFTSILSTLVQESGSKVQVCCIVAGEEGLLLLDNDGVGMDCAGRELTSHC